MTAYLPSHKPDSIYPLVWLRQLITTQTMKQIENMEWALVWYLTLCTDFIICKMELQGCGDKLCVYKMLSMSDT